MPITYKKNVAIFEGICTVEEAEGLSEWLASQPRRRVNLKSCEHLHTAILQVLMAAKPEITIEPTDRWLLMYIVAVIRGDIGTLCLAESPNED